MKRELVALVIWMFLKTAVGEPGYELSPYQESPGVYFEDLGHATLSTTTWTIIVYIPLQATASETTDLERYARYIDGTCSKLTVRNWTACSHFGDTINRRLQQIRSAQRLLSDIVQNKEDDKRHRRGLFNFVGKISKALFGTMDDDDAQYYHEQVDRFEQGSTTLTQLVKQQLIVVKSTLGTFNETLTDVDYNERKMREGLNHLQTYVTTFGAQIENATHLLSLKITLEDHIARALDASLALQRALDVLIDSIADAQKGTLPQRVAPPTLLLDALRNSSPSFPPDTTLPFPLGKDYVHALYQLCDVRVYIFRERLSYVISVPLVHKRTFSVFKMIPIPVPVNQNNFVYIDVGESILCIDRAKQYYFTMKEGELAHCKVLETGQYVCTQQRTLLSTSTGESCAVMMLQKKGTLPMECDTRLVRLSRTVWTQLTDNTWIYFAPQPDTVTILCQNENPVDVNFKGIGKLQIYKGCKGYGATAILHSSFNIGSANTRIKGDFLSQVTLQYDCCEELGMQINLSRLIMDLTYKKTVSHLDDLKYASKKVSDLLEDVKEQEWRNNHAVYHDTHSVLLFLVLSVVFAYLMYKLYIYARQRTPGWFCKKEVSAAPTDVSCTVGHEPRGSTVNINIRNSNDSLQLTDATPPSPKRSLRPRVAKTYF